MILRKVAVVQPLLVPGGGTEAVTAWTLEALKREYQVTLFTFNLVDAQVLNRYYGTELGQDEFSIIRPRLPPLLKGSKRFSLLKDHLMMRYCKSVSEGFDLFIGVGGLMDLGRQSIQYVALAPASTLMKVLSNDPGTPRLYRLAKSSFMRLCQGISGFSKENLERNTTVATSKWAGKAIAEVSTVKNYQVIYPPVDALLSRTPWGIRREGFLCIARIVPEKLIEQAVEILKRVRERGFDVSLRIIGRQDDRHYFKKIRQLVEENASWVSVDGLLPKGELLTLMDQYKYGINAARDEPFGIAVAEMVKAGCLIFVANGGGQTEIVDAGELTYDDIDDAVGKITRVLSDEKLQRSLLDRLNDQGESFSTQAFCHNIRRVVHGIFAGREDRGTI